MSDYHHEKVLRVPFMKYPNFYKPNNNDPDDFKGWMEEKYPNLIKYAKPGYFQFAPTEEHFLDFVLEADYDMYDGDWGKVRELKDEEQRMWKPVFEKLIPNIDMSDVHLVEYCWYNCCEAPDYYSLDPAKDAFYATIPGPETIGFSLGDIRRDSVT